MINNSLSWYQCEWDNTNPFVHMRVQPYLSYHLSPQKFNSFSAIDHSANKCSLKLDVDSRTSRNRREYQTTQIHDMFFLLTINTLAADRLVFTL